MLGILGKLGRRGGSAGGRSVSGAVRSASALTGGSLQARGGRVINNAVAAASGSAPRASRMPGEYTPVASQILRGKPGMGGSVPVEAATQTAMDSRMAQAVAARRAQMAQPISMGPSRNVPMGPPRPSNRELYAGRRRAFLNQANTQPVTMGPTRNMPPSARERGVAGRRAFLEQSQRAARVRANVAASQASRTGGFRRSGVGRPGPTASRTATAAQPGVTSGTGATASKGYRAQPPTASAQAGTQNKPIRSMSQRYKDMSPKTRRMLMIGGAAAVGVTAASNRRGNGSDAASRPITNY